MTCKTCYQTADATGYCFRCWLSIRRFQQMEGERFAASLARALVRMINRENQQ